jgi:hypothetical protein
VNLDDGRVATIYLLGVRALTGDRRNSEPDRGFSSTSFMYRKGAIRSAEPPSRRPEGWSWKEGGHRAWKKHEDRGCWHGGQRQVF